MRKTPLSARRMRRRSNGGLKDVVRILTKIGKPNGCTRLHCPWLICLRRLPLQLARDVPYKRFLKTREACKAGRWWDYKDGTVTIIELPGAAHEAATREFEKCFDRSFNSPALRSS